MNRRLARLLSGTAPLAFALIATGCASSATVVPGRTLALASVEYPEGFSAVGLQSGEEPPTARFAQSSLRELGREKRSEVVDARNRGAKFADLGKSSARTEALRRDVPGDAYLAVRVYGCEARPMTERERRGGGATAVDVTVCFLRGECAPEVTAFDATGKILATVQQTGRWDSPRQERPDSVAVQSQVLGAAIDDAARRLAREIRPAASEKKEEIARRGGDGPTPRSLPPQALAGTSAATPRASATRPSCSIAKMWCEPGAGLAEKRRPA